MNFLKNTTLVFLFTLLLVSCSGNDDIPVLINEEEVITTTIVTLTSNTNPTITLTARDADGDGPLAPEIIISGNLQANTTYQASVQLLNETESPAEDITEEVEDEAEEHQFFYQTSNTLNISSTYNDMDSNGFPIGISFSLTTGQPSSGSFTVVLRHEPNKEGANVSDGDLTNADGETDVSQTFNITIE